MSHGSRHLFEPIDIGPIRLENRIIMGSMHTGLEGGEGPLDQLATFYRRRAEGGVGLIVTGGFAPNYDANLGTPREEMASADDVARHKPVTQAVEKAGGKIALQILHAGRYSYHDHSVSASAIRSPINRTAPRALTDPEIEQTIDDYVNCAMRAQEAGYHGVEIMGSEGYLITQFLAERTNHREDEWGGALENRMRFAVEIVKRTRARVGEDFLIIFRHSALDLVDGGMSGEDTKTVAKAIEAAGADMINTGIGWHEAQIPTIAQPVPAAAFSWATRRLKEVLSIPVAAANRIHTPEDAEAVLARGDADLVSLARPFLADPDFVEKAKAGKRSDINLCISCNQACLDHYFMGKSISCLVNPAAADEASFEVGKSQKPKKIVVVGGGMAGMAAATTAAERGHDVTLYEGADVLGGQFNLARNVPGKAVFGETISYFEKRMRDLGVTCLLGVKASPEEVLARDPDHLIVATGVSPRRPDIAGIGHPKVVTYTQALEGTAPIGEKVAIIGGGGIAYDVSLYLLHRTGNYHSDISSFNKHWGIDPESFVNGGLVEVERADQKASHQITLLKRSEGPFGRTLGRTTGWVHRRELQRAGVKTLANVIYDRIDDEGLHFTMGGEARLLECDTVILCAGQDSVSDLMDSDLLAHLKRQSIGGAHYSAELDAKRAIDEGTRLAISL